jgi:CRP-like cAMP-binding protein
MGHADLRVQQEVLNTAINIGDENLKDFLLQALQTIADPLKSKVVNHIAAAHDERFVRPLTDLLESTKPFAGKNKNDLQLAICKTLGVMGSKRATASLNRVVQSKNVLGLGGFSEEVRQAAGQALDQIREIPPPLKGRDFSEKESANEQEVPSTRAATGTPSIAVDSEETAIFTMAAQGKTDQAKERLLDLIATTARAGDFPTAERLRERIYEIDNLAMGETIRSGEIIEQEKQGAISEEDLAIWADLTDRLSSEEFQTMYHELSERRYKPEETIVSQGDKNDALFFIAQGSVKLSHRVGPREIFITSLNRGQIAGENFFAPSFWTVTLTSLTPSKVYILQQATLNSWQERFPQLRTKLHEFYLACSNIRSMLEKKGLERRQDQRFTLARKIQVQPITTLDTTIGRGFRAETVDISQGGLAFLIRISKQENARLLLGRRMQVVLPIGGQTNFLYLKGLVISIQPFQILENDFSVHFKFEYPLDQQRLQSILG